MSDARYHRPCRRRHCRCVRLSRHRATVERTSIDRGPGTASVSRVVTASATVTAIDLTTREVTLRRDNGSTFTVVAGPDVRNLPQIRVGDTVHVDFHEALAIELKKGGTGAPASRSETATRSRAEPGQRPGGVATRETVIVADVIAGNAADQTVSLRGPGGRVSARRSSEALRRSETRVERVFTTSDGSRARSGRRRLGDRRGARRRGRARVVWDDRREGQRGFR